MTNILDYIYTILYQYVSISSIIVFISIVIPILVLGWFWKSAARNRVIQILGDIHRRYK